MKNKQKFLFRWNSRQAGFTLIELLVVIVIIGILATISVSSFNGYQKKARDTNRIQQFTESVNLIKQYVIVNEKLPTLTASASIADCANWRVANKLYKEQIIELGTDFGYTFTENYWDQCRGFAFYIYDPAYLGTKGCPDDKGDLLVFATTLEQIRDGDKTAEELGVGEYGVFHCTNREWVGEVAGGKYDRDIVFGIFENGDFGQSSL